MNVLTMIQSLNDRALRLGKEAEAICTETAQLQAVFHGDPARDAASAPVSAKAPVAPVSAKAPAPAKAPALAKAPAASPAQMPNRDTIRAQAAEHGVDVDDLLPTGKKPTLLQKQEALQRIEKAMRKHSAATSRTPSNA